MKIYEFSNGDEVHKYKKSIVICFGGPRKVLSTGPRNGGYREDLTSVYNNDGNPGPGIAFTMRAETYPQHMDVLAIEDLGLDPERSSGMCTAADMDNVSIQTLSYDDFSVTAIVTGGIKRNGGRVGDPAFWHERSNHVSAVEGADHASAVKGADHASVVEGADHASVEEGTTHPPTVESECDNDNQTKQSLGTINILLYIDADLDEGALARALVTCTEAKTAALQELIAPSRSSHGIATGSGTDSAIIVSNAESNTYLTSAGKHCKLGEYIGRTVKAAVKEALNLQSGLNPEYQHDIINRMDRYGITEDTLWKTYSKNPENVDKRFLRAHFTDALDQIKKDERLVTYTSLYAHLLDQLDWGLLSTKEVWEAAKNMLQLAGLMKADDFPPYLLEETAKDKILEKLVYIYKKSVVNLIQGRAFT